MTNVSRETDRVLTPDRVEELLNLVLAGDENTGIRWNGVVNDYQLDPEKAEAHRGEIQAMLGELDDTFMDDGGGGWSFLNLCQDRHDYLWTGLHWTCEKLLALGAALDLVSFSLPREFWNVLPKSMPYVTIKRSQFK